MVQIKKTMQWLHFADFWPPGYALRPENAQLNGYNVYSEPLCSFCF